MATSLLSLHYIDLHRMREVFGVDIYGRLPRRIMGLMCGWSLFRPIWCKASYLLWPGSIIHGFMGWVCTWGTCFGSFVMFCWFEILGYLIGNIGGSYYLHIVFIFGNCPFINSSAATRWAGSWRDSAKWQVEDVDANEEKVVQGFIAGPRWTKICMGVLAVTGTLCRTIRAIFLYLVELPIYWYKIAHRITYLWQFEYFESQHLLNGIPMNPLIPYIYIYIQCSNLWAACCPSRAG